jgi:hypothetical protein
MKIRSRGGVYPRPALPEAQPMADVAARDGGQAESDPEKNNPENPV